MADEPKPFPGYLFGLFQLLYLAICYPTQNNYVRKWILGPSMVSIALYMWTQTSGLPDALLTLTIGCTIVNNLLVMTYLVYMQPGFPDFWRRVKDPEQSPSTFSLRRKVGWTIDLAWGTRRVGWVQEPKGVLPPRPMFKSRFAFVASRIGYALVHFLVLDLTRVFTAGNPAFDNRVHLSTDGAETYIRSLPLMWQVASAMMTGIVAVSSIALPFNIVPALFVALGLYDSQDWLPIFGSDSFKHAYTVRGFWGKSWHQMLRPLISGIGKHVANKTFNFTPGTNLSAYTQLYIGFFLSGIIHMGGDCMVMQDLFVFFTVRFFLLQAVAITVEDFVQWCTKSWRLKMGWTSKAVGFCWVLVWFSWSAPLWFDYLNKNGNTTADPVIFSREMFLYITH